MYKCDLCESEKTKLIYLKKETDNCILVYDKNKTLVHSRIYICTECGLMFTADQMSDEELDDFYMNTYRKFFKYNPSQTLTHIDTAVGIFKEYIKECSNVLDIGCYNGEFTRKLNLDIKKHTIDYAKQENYTPTYLGNFMNYEFPLKFNCITLFNALEHFKSPTNVLNKIYELLDEDGTLMFSVPLLPNNVINNAPCVWFSSAHLYHFTKATIINYLNKTGFKLTNCIYTNEAIGLKGYFIVKKDKKQPIEKKNIIPYYYTRYILMWDAFYKAYRGIL